MDIIKVKRLDVEAILPTRSNEHDAGLDLYAIEDVLLCQGTTTKVRTGIAIQIPQGMVGKIEDRSSMALKGLRTGGGVVDSGYTGSVDIVMHNFSAHTGCGGPYPIDIPGAYQIKRGDKIAQLLLYKIETPSVIEVNELDETVRGSNGFGSSGI